MPNLPRIKASLLEGIRVGLLMLAFIVVSAMVIVALHAFMLLFVPLSG